MAEQTPIILTVEQETTLEVAKKERMQVQHDLLDAEERTRAAEAQRKELLSTQTLKDAAASGPKWYEPELVINYAKVQHDLRFDADGNNGTGVVNGRRVPLKDVFAAIADKYPSLVSDKRTLPKSAEQTPKARSEMTRAERIAFIHAHGANGDIEFGKLPAYPVRTVEVRTMKDYSSLPVATKTALLAKHGMKWLESLPRR
jgi:hypothetical protein